MNDAHLNSVLQVYRQSLQMLELSQKQAELLEIAEDQLNRCQVPDSRLLPEAFHETVRTVAIAEDPWLASMRAERVKLEQIILSYSSVAALQAKQCSYAYPDVCYDYDYAHQYILDVRDLVDGRTEEQRQKYRITPHQEKQLPQFAKFFTKLKQLILDLMQALAHAKRRIHIGNKITLTSLLQVLHSSETHSRHENSTVTRASGLGSHQNFHVNGSIFSESEDSRRSLVCEGFVRIVGLIERTGPATPVASATS